MKPKRYLKSKLLLLLGLTGTFLLFQNCQIQRPSVENWDYASVAFPHTGTETSCASCHEGSRPNSTVGFLALNSNTPFDYATHAGGTDCISCHNMNTQFRTRPDWGNGHFDHPATLNSCSSCHSSQRPGNSAVDLALTNGFDHTTAGQGECFTCHSGTMKSSFSSLSDWGTAMGVPSQLAWDPSLDVQPFAQMPSFAGTVVTSITTVTPAQRLHMAMNHRTISIPSSQLSNCNMCHSNGTYSGGRLHSSLNANGFSQPSSCVDCHDSSSIPAGFVGPATPNPFSPRTPNSNEMRHDAVAWSKTSGSTYARTSMGIVNSDCAVCHNSPAGVGSPVGVSWSNSNYHVSLANKGITQPSSCLDCHANSRPTGEVAGTLTKFTHSSDVQGMGDCTSCHASTSSWVGGKFHVAGVTAPTNCNSCHNYQRPLNDASFTAYNAAVKPFDVLATQNPSNYHGGTRDCSSCHNPGLYTSMANWSGGTFNHAAANAAGKLTSCVDCHSSQRPANPIQPSALNGLTSPFNHTTDGQGDCIACHKATITRGTYSNYLTAFSTSWGDTDWRGAVTYDPAGLMGPDPAAILTKVNATKLNYSNPATFQVASTTANTQTLLDQMMHSSTQIPSTLWTGGVVGSTLNTATCNTCHTSLPTKYAPGHFHTVVPSGGLTSCKECHVNTNPSDIVGTNLKPMDHAATFKTGNVDGMDCVSCHVKAQAGTSFNNAGFHNKIGAQEPSSCANCHYPTLPADPYPFTGKRTYTLGIDHRSNYASGDCNKCHSLTNSQVSSLVTANGAVLANWSGGTFHKNVSPSTINSCTECHGPRPTAVSTSLNDGQHMSHQSAFVPADCVSCHRSDLTAGVTPTDWSKSAQFHSNVTGVTTCKECHTSDLPTGLTDSNTLSTFPAGNTTFKDQIIHTDVTVTGKDCNVCHNSMGLTGPKWLSGSYHAKVTVTAATNCLSCHSNILANIRNNFGGMANGMDHSVASIGSQNCTNCHTFPGTGVVGSTTNPPNWKGAIGGVPATITVPPPTTATSWGNLTTPHPSMNLAGESCASCHGTSIGSKIQGYDHLNPPSGMKCVYCHTTGQQVVNTAAVIGFNTKGVTHEGGVSPSRDCSSCHNTSRFIQFSYPSYNSGTGRWSGGKWK